MTDKKNLSLEEIESLLAILKNRFETNMNRHESVTWDVIQEKLMANPEKLWSLSEMEKSGGEPDIIERRNENFVYTFYDCSLESPAGRRSLCYDHQALVARKKNKPQDSALNMAAFMGIDMLTQEQYHMLQQFGEFDLKSSTWIITPDEIRTLGGALFCDRRYNHVFVYHNGADSYYSARGFRGCLKI